MHNEASRDYSSAHLTNFVCVYRGIFVFSPWHWSTCIKLELHVLLDGGSSSTPGWGLISPSVEHMQQAIQAYPSAYPPVAWHLSSNVRLEQVCDGLDYFCQLLQWVLQASHFSWVFFRVHVLHKINIVVFSVRDMGTHGSPPTRVLEVPDKWVQHVRWSVDPHVGPEDHIDNPEDVLKTWCARQDTRGGVTTHICPDITTYRL
jgi:hypothetical protein